MNLYHFECCGKKWKSQQKITYCYKCRNKVYYFCSAKYECWCGNKWTILSPERDVEKCRKCNNYVKCSFWRPLINKQEKKINYSNIKILKRKKCIL
jgi:hypothetical protein